MLGNVSPKFRSSLKSIQLLALVEKPVYDKYGMDKILEPAIADIKELEKVCSFLIPFNVRMYNIS